MDVKLPFHHHIKVMTILCYHRKFQLTWLFLGTVPHTKGLPTQEVNMFGQVFIQVEVDADSSAPSIIRWYWRQIAAFTNIFEEWDETLAIILISSSSTVHGSMWTDRWRDLRQGWSPSAEAAYHSGYKNDGFAGIWQKNLAITKELYSYHQLWLCPAAARISPKWLATWDQLVGQNFWNQYSQHFKIIWPHHFQIYSLFRTSVAKACIPLYTIRGENCFSTPPSFADQILEELVDYIPSEFFDHSSCVLCDRSEGVCFIEFFSIFLSSDHVVPLFLVVVFLST